MSLAFPKNRVPGWWLRQGARAAVVSEAPVTRAGETGNVQRSTLNVQVGEMKKVCSWCQAHIEGDPAATRVSHGMCPDCFVKFSAEVCGAPPQIINHKS